MAIDYTPITELPGTRASREQLEIGYHRYHLALEHSAGKDVLEVGCGGGQGLGYLATRARRVVGGDYTFGSVQVAARHYRGRVPLLRLDAHTLPFADGSFDVVLLFEAIYYLTDPGRFLDECHRILRPGGTVIISSVNKDWSDFNPSAYSTRYLGAGELQTLLEAHGFAAQVLGAFPVVVDSLSQSLVSCARRAAVRLHLIPKSFKYKALLKRLVYGRLVPLPAELTDGLAPYEPPAPLDAAGSGQQWKILYAIGQRR